MIPKNKDTKQQQKKERKKEKTKKETTDLKIDQQDFKIANWSSNQEKFDA